MFRSQKHDRQKRGKDETEDGGGGEDETEDGEGRMKRKMGREG